MKIDSSAVLVTVVLILAGRMSPAQQNPHGQVPVTSVAEPYVFLIRDPVVHDDLGLTARQRQSVGTLNDELDSELWSMRNKSAGHITQTIQKTAATAKKRLASVLTAAQQRRLGQIELWTLGTRAFTRDELPQQLGLSTDQLDEIRDTVKRTQEAISELTKKLQAGGSRESLEKESRALRTDEQKKIFAVLSPEQQQQWIALLGKRIDVSKLGHVKFKAPELYGREGWVNSAPLTLRQLKGKVVALHFYAFG